MATTEYPTTSDRLVPYEEQQAFVYDTDTRYHAFISGIGAGKTTAGIARVLMNVTRWNRGETGMVIAPTIPAVRNVIIPEMREWGVFEIGEYHTTEKRLEFENGSEIIFESADSQRKIERLRGTSLAWFWIDEAAQVNERAWEIMTGRLRQGEYLNAFVTTTPKGKNWVHEKFIAGDPGAVNTTTHVPTQANPHTPETYTDEVVEEYEGRFYEQEVLGEFVGFEGLVYPWFDDETHVIDSDPDEFDRVIYGVDWGFSHPSVALVIALRGDQPVVLDEVYESRLTDDDLAREVAALQDTYGEGVVYCDPAEPGSIETFRREGLDAIDADNDVTPGIKTVTQHDHDLRVHARCQNLINEFGMYQYRDGGDSDRVRKQNDHAMDALRYALHTADVDGGIPTARASFGGGGRDDTSDDSDEQTIGDLLPDPTEL
jgi:PBSX family phage terminase large subunit